MLLDVNLQRLPISRGPSTIFCMHFCWTSIKCIHDNSRVHFRVSFTAMFDRRSIRYNRSVIMKRKPGLSLNHIAETLFANETFVKKAALRLYKKQN